jgi:radical SAM superfamily enzyme YgiQ (UPF0313 family)
MKVVFVSLFDEVALGIRYLSATLRRAGHETAVIHMRRLADINVFPETIGDGDYHLPPAYISARELALFAETLRRLRPDLIAFSLTSNFVAAAEHLTRLARPFGTKIVWGGIDMLCDPERALRSADVICRGEGEEALLELVATLERGGDWRRIPNLWVRDGDAIVRNPARPPIADLDSLPYPDHDLEHFYAIYNDQVVTGRYPEGSQLVNSYTVLTARGCPFCCTYCCSPAVNAFYGDHKYLRRRKTATVIDELRDVKRRRGAGLEFISFHDDVFTVNPAWVHEFAGAYQREIGLRFWCFTHPTAVRREMMEDLKAAGLDFVVIGLQSGSERVLSEFFKRRTSREAIVKSIAILTDLRIKIAIDLIGSNPFETEDDRRETFDLLMSLPRPFAIHPVNPLTIYKGSEIYEMARRDPAVWAKLEEYNNNFLARREPIYEFWNALHELTQYECFTREELCAMAGDEYLQRNPEFVQMLLRVAKSLYYYANNITVVKDPYIRRLEDRIYALERPSIRSLARQLAGRVRRKLMG